MHSHESIIPDTSPFLLRPRRPGRPWRAPRAMTRRARHRLLPGQGERICATLPGRAGPARSATLEERREDIADARAKRALGNGRPERREGGAPRARAPGEWQQIRSTASRALSSIDIGADFCAEVSMKKKRINDNKPIVVGLAILQHAKLLLLKFMNFIGKFFFQTK